MPIRWPRERQARQNEVRDGSGKGPVGALRRGTGLGPDEKRSLADVRGRSSPISEVLGHTDAHVTLNVHVDADKESKPRAVALVGQTPRRDPLCPSLKIAPEAEQAACDGCPPPVPSA